MARLLLDAGDSSVLIDGDRVVAVGRDAGVVGEGVERIECGTDAVIRGGAVNAHTHLYSGLAPLGMPPPDPPPSSFVEILQRVWWRLDRALDEETLRAAARLYLADALLAGTTAVVDHHESPSFIEGSLDVLADAAQEIGIRLATGYGITERNRGRDEAQAGLAECARFARANRRPLVKPLVAMHASFTLSDRSIDEAGDLARDLSVPMHVHVAEDMADSLDAHKRGFNGAFARLKALDALPPGSILAHGVDLDDETAAQVGEEALWLVQNPRSNKGNRVGWPYALTRCSRVALGTDGYPSQMLDEWLACADGMIEFADGRAAEGGEELARRRNGGRVLASELFGIAVGAQPEPGDTADLAVYEVPGLSAARLRTVLEEPDLYRDRRKIVSFRPKHVVVAGRAVVRDGRLLTADEAAIRATASVAAVRLWQRMAAFR